MVVEFKYDLEKDIENFFSVAKYSKANSNSTIKNRYQLKYGFELTSDNLKSFISEEIKEQQLDLDLIAKQYQNNWNLINDEFFSRCDKLFSYVLPGNKVSAYLTVCDRCGYNIENNYFFVSVHSNKPKLTTIHELWHFYTWYAFADKLQFLDKDNYYIVKESLTVIINHEFKDWLDGSDVGQAAHQPWRREIEEIWLKEKNLPEVINYLKNNYKSI